MITVGDLQDYLEKFPKDMQVELDHDGWMEDETGLENPTPYDIIHRRGLFWDGKTCLIINN